MTIKITALGHAVLRTADLAHSLAFYRDVLGLHEVAAEQFDGQQWVFLTSGRTHHDLALVEDPSGSTTGPLHHLGFKVGDSIEELVRVKEALERSDVAILAALDFRVSQAIFITDPDGTTIELYVDTPGEPWRTNPAMVASAIPLTI
jgi:catechol 2,3-dioxygenase